MSRASWSSLSGELLRLIAASGRGERFTLRDVAPARPTRFLVAFQQLLDAGLVERVPVSCGAWFYRLTPAGAKQAGAAR